MLAPETMVPVCPSMSEANHAVFLVCDTPVIALLASKSAEIPEE